jgi:alpha-L-arabinofuranosidase
LHRPTPDYFQSFGLGFFEFFQLCEDIGAEPLPILNCGMACQFNSGELVPLDELHPYLQDALDLIEFANGPVSTRWGAKRAALGHPEPFGMKMLGVGNEQWGPQYVERYARFANVVKANYPGLMLVSDAGPSPDDERFHFLWPKLRELNADIVDEHCYASPQWFLLNTHRYDNYDRTGPKVFMGEYAAQSDQPVSVKNRNHLECAIAEAAYMTGLERNADVVRMASYAPLFAHEEAWQWTPDLIWVNNLGVLATPSYYVQQLFSRNRGDQVLPTEIKEPPGQTPGAAGFPPRLFASAARETASREIILKVVNAANSPVEARIKLDSSSKVARRAAITLLTGPNSDAVNSFDQPHNVAPVQSTIRNASNSFRYLFPAHSITVMRLKNGVSS